MKMNEATACNKLILGITEIDLFWKSIVMKIDFCILSFSNKSTVF